MSAVYGYGSQWTGALSRGRENLICDEAPELSAEEMLQFGECQNMVQLKGLDGMKCVAASAGWGHTALIIAQDGVNVAATSRKLMVCGRPHDFQTVMRLRRLPSAIRNFCIKYSLPLEDECASQSGGIKELSILQRIASFLAGENDVTFNEEEHRRYSNIPELLQIKLPSPPSVEGDRIDDEVFEIHGRKNEENGSKHQPMHTHYQNTLATSAGTTAVVSNTGTLYMFGMNHRGQCGSGTFSPNVWTPSPIRGLASKRFILDHGKGIGENLFKEFVEQENPIVSVALGLQHGIALDSEGQVFCWGKGERGQLGQGRKLANNAQGLGEDEPNENRTFEHALIVANFYDPYTTTSSKQDIYAPLLSPNDSKILLISAGMNFSVAVTSSNIPYIWGKNCVPNPSFSASEFNLRSKPVEDSTYPRYIPGLPTNLQIMKVVCGTHHASMLLEDGSIWAVGVATDSPVPMWNEAVEILSAGIIDTSEIISFQAGFDRTVVVSGLSNSRRQVIEIQLWSREELRQYGAVHPSYLDWLQQNDRLQRVRSVHRGWMHTVIVTESFD
jgi:alpha-tubulin suppressor-like RCC1 family protein